MSAVQESTSQRLLASPELVGFLESGVVLYVATRSEDLEPESLIAFGAKVEPDSDRLTVYLVEAAAAQTLANLHNNGQIALSAVKVTDYKSLQLKGELVSSRPANEAEQQIQMRYVGMLGEQLGKVGVPRSVGMRIIFSPAVAITMRVREIFVQTPGRRAGYPLENVEGFLAARNPQAAS